MIQITNDNGIPTSYCFTCAGATWHKDGKCMRCLIYTSDYGYYGATEVFDKHILPTRKCKCGHGGLLHSYYDDTVGFKDTSYYLECKECELITGCTSIIDDVIKQWNVLVQDLSK